MAPSFGYVVPSSSGDGVPSAGMLKEIALAADGGQLEYLWVSDHLLWWLPMYESLSLLSWIAASTSRVRIGTAVLQLAMREPVATAKMLASIDRLSDGRLTLGVGVGGEFPPEWEATKTDRTTRGKRTDEMLDAFEQLWGDAVPKFKGKHIDVGGIDLQPKPVGTIPVWIGGRSEPSVRRAAERGDGWMGLFLTPERYAGLLERCNEFCEQRGREPSEVLPSLYVWTCIADTDAEARRLAESALGGFYNIDFDKLGKYAIYGSATTCAERFAEFSEAGIKHFAVSPIWHKVSAEPLHRLMTEVAPRVSS